MRIPYWASPQLAFAYITTAPWSCFPLRLNVALLVADTMVWQWDYAFQRGTFCFRCASHDIVHTASGATRPLDRTGIEPVNSPLWSAVPTMLTVNQLVTPVNECLSLIAESFVSYCTIVMASALTRSDSGVCPFGSHPTACGHPYHGLTLSDVFRSQYLSFTCLLWARHCPLHCSLHRGLIEHFPLRFRSVSSTSTTTALHGFMYFAALPKPY